jgi:hypothetical protein
MIKNIKNNKNLNIKTKIVHIGQEPFDVCIDRTTIFGCPFVIGVDGTRNECINKYREWIKTKPELLNEIYKLEGKALGCWCKPKPCHGDVIVEIIEAYRNRENLKLLEEKENV